MIPFFLAMLLLGLVAGSSEATERFMTNNGLTSGACLTSGTACRFSYVMGLTVAGDTVTMVCGTYQGANNMLAIWPAFAGKSGTSGNRITLRAETDGCVFIDGQFTNFPFITEDNDYWTFSGFDVGNSSGSVIIHFASNNGIFQRVCASNINPTASGQSNHVFFMWNSSNNLVEDTCLFGQGRNMIIEFGDGTAAGSSGCARCNTSVGNTYRRVWMSHEGHKAGGVVGLPSIQPNYHTGTGANLYENIIMRWSGEQVASGYPCFNTPGSYAASPGTLPSFTDCGTTSEGVGMRQNDSSGNTTYTFRGMVNYGKNSDANYNQYPMPLPSPNNFIAATNFFFAGQNVVTVVDWYSDSSGIPVGPFLLDCASSPCSSTADRITGIRSSLSATGWGTHQDSGSQIARWTVTNNNECTSRTGCPNFYTGDSPGTGARNCFRYVDGTLTSTPLWPWPMDDRIKAALARANAAGTGGSALAGTALSGAYAANTVTSEIVSRYGSVPTACLTSSSFTPSFPVASDFPSVSVRDDFNRANAGTLGGGWTELLSDTFSIVSNAAAAPSGGGGFARAIYSDTQMQTDHEVYATWTTLAATSGFVTMLSFAGTDLTLNNQYRVRVNRTTGSNTTVEVRRVNSVGTETVIMSGVDLGIEAVDGNSFGVRVSGTTISVYWKWTDDVWYRIGQFTDANLPASGGVYGGIASGSPSVIDNYGAGPFVTQPPQNPPSPPSSVGAGRFGTTFPSMK